MKNEDKINSYYIYCRKSSEQEDRQVLSLESQTNELKALILKQSLSIAEILTESKSAKSPFQRPLFEKMVAQIEKGKANGIVVWNADRLSRNAIDIARLIHLFDIGKLSEIVTPSQTFKNTPNDKFLLNLLCSQAKLENDNKGINVKRGLKTKAELGWLPSGAKPGYMNDKYADKGSKTIKSDPERFPLIRKAWDLMLTGAYSPPQILRLLNEWGYKTPTHRRIGGKPMSMSMIYKVFTDPFYYGEFEYPSNSDIWHKGRHEPMISKDEFNRVQMLLGRKGNPRSQTLEFAYTGVIRCGECSGAITAEEKWQIICSSCKQKFASKNKAACPKCHTLIENMKKPTRLHYIYYHCAKRKNPQCSQLSIQVNELEKQIAEKLSNIQISERFKKWAIKYLNEVYDNEAKETDIVLESLQKSYADCKKKLENLLRLKIDPENDNGFMLSDEEFKNQKTLLLKEKQGIEEKLTDYGDHVEKWLEFTEKAFNFACYAKTHFEEGNLQTKKEILLSLGSNLVLKDKKLDINLIIPFQFLEEVKSREPTISPAFEPKEKGFDYTKLEASWASNPSLLPEPWANITLDYEAIIKAFQDNRYIGELRQRWNEIKKLQNHSTTLSYSI